MLEKGVGFRIVAGILVIGQFVIMANNVLAATGGISNGDGVLYEPLPTEDYRALAHQDGYNWLYRSQENMNNTSVEGNTIHFGDPNVQQVLQETGGELNTDEFSAATSDPNIEAQYYASGQAPNLSDLQALSEADETTIGNMTTDSMDTWEADASASTSTSIQGNAYATINAVGSKGTASLTTSDPMFSKVENVTSSLTGGIFSDCTLDQQLISSTETVHKAEIKTCTDMAVGGCTLTHNVEPSILQYGNSASHVIACEDNRDNCVGYVIGTYTNPTGNSMYSGDCEDSEVIQTFLVKNGKAVTRARISRVYYAGAIIGYMRATNETIGKDRVLYGFNNNDDFLNTVNSSGFVCSGGQGQKWHAPATDLTDLLQGYDAFTIVTKSKGYPGFAVLEVDFDPTKVAANDDWADDTCEASALAIGSGAVQGTISCTEYHPMVGSNKINVSGVAVETQYLTQIPGVPVNCAKATVSVSASNFDSGVVSCDTYSKDSSCGYVSTECKVWSQDNMQCLLTQSSYDCGYNADYEIAREGETYDCPGGFQCMGIDCLNIMVGDASEDFTKAMGLMQQSQQAAGDVSCATSSDITGFDPNVDNMADLGDISCSFFGGTQEICNDWDLVISGNDCCREPGSEADMAQFVRQTMHLWKVESFKNMIKTGDILENVSWSGGSTLIYSMGWDMFRNYTGVGQSITKLENTITKPIVNTLNNIVPYAGDVFKGVTLFVEDELIRMGMEYVLKFLYREAAAVITDAAMSLGIKLASDEAADGAAGATGEGAEAFGEAYGGGVSGMAGAAVAAGLEKMGVSAATASAVGGVVAGVVSFVGWVYVAYQVTKILINILTACKNDEIELQTKIRLQQCDYVDRWCSKRLPLVHTCIRHSESYCCYKSPLSRILNKQIRLQLNGCANYLFPHDDHNCAWGYGDEAHCEGLTFDQMQQIDWQRIDLTEWLSLLQTSGALTTSGIEASMSNYLPIGGYDTNGNYHDSNNQVYHGNF